MKRWSLGYQRLEDDGIIHEVLGSIPRYQIDEWFFGIPNSEKVLSILSYESTGGSKTIYFTRYNLVDVPKNALIR
ncbi:unnamed protein product [Caenorhabditis nigoni]